MRRAIASLSRFSLMARASFFIVDARSGEPLLELGSFPSFSAAHKEAGHLIGSFSFPLSVANARYINTAKASRFA